MVEIEKCLCTTGSMYTLLLIIVLIVTVIILSDSGN